MSSLALRDVALLEVSKIMRGVSEVFSPSDTVSKLIGYFTETDFYEAVVTDEGRVGIVTIRDLLNTVQPQRTKLGRLWRSVGSLTSTKTVSDAVDLMFQNSTRAIPIIEGSKTVGVLSQAEIARTLSGVNELEEILVTKVMKHPVTTIGFQSRISSARKLMLDNKISHVPVLSAGKVLGVATARNIVYHFIVPTDKTERGERIGEVIGRLDGPVSGILDVDPFTATPETSCLEATRGFTSSGKSACLVMGVGGELLGMLTPWEIVSILRRSRVEEEKLPITILGISDEDGFFESSVAEEKLRRVIERNARFYTQMQEVVVRVERKNLGGEQTRYELTAHIRGPLRQLHAKAQGWDLLKVFDELCDNLDRLMRRTKPEPKERPSRRKLRMP